MSEENFFKVKQYSISNEFFEKGYSSGQGPCNCTAECCNGGVWTDVKEHELIISKKELIKQQMDETQTRDESRWFEHEAVNDADFPSGRAIGTEVVNDKCAFLDKFGRCSIQLAAVAAEEHRWAWKPVYCILFPIEISNNVIGFDPMLQDEQRCCTISSEFETPLFIACKDELTHVLGEDGYRMLEEHYATLSKSYVVEIKG